MGLGRLLTILVLLVLNLAVAIFLQSKLTSFFSIEIIFVILMILIGIVLLVGIGANAKWVWPIMTLYFSASLANLLFLFLSTNAIIIFMFAVFINLVGMMIAILSITDAMPSVESSPVETYEIETPREVRVETRTTRKRKSSKKRRRR